MKFVLTAERGSTDVLQQSLKETLDQSSVSLVSSRTCVTVQSTCDYRKHVLIKTYALRIQMFRIKERSE